MTVRLTVSLYHSKSRELTVIVKAPREHQYRGMGGNSLILCRPRGGRPAAMELIERLSYLSACVRRGS